MFNQTHASQTTETMDSDTQNIIKTGMSNIVCSGLTASDQDLRKTKNELFSKLIERQQTVVTTHNKTISEENLSSNRYICRVKAGGSDLLSNVGLNAGHNHVIATTANGLEMSSGRLEEPILFSRIRGRWYTNDEVASILTNFNSHPEWQTNELQVRPQSGAVLLYSREKVRYRQDGYCWKKRKNGRTTREDHMKLKVQGIECIYGCYVHSALLPTFHRRCYWLLENPDIVLVHYLNQPPDDKNKMIVTFNSNLLEADTRRRWTNEEIMEEIGSVFGGISQIHNTLDINFPTAEQQLQAVSLAQMNNNMSGADADTSLVQQLQQQNPPDSNCDKRGLITPPSKLLVTLPENDLPPPQDSLRQSMNYPVGNNDRSNNMYNMMSTQDITDNKQRVSRCDDDEMMTTTSQDSDDGSHDYGRQRTLEQHRQASKGRAIESPDTVVGCDVTVKLESNLTNFSAGQNDPDAQEATTSRRDAGRDYQNIRQDPCSPVTQIYNKIVDDIETYALPLEMNQYDPVTHNDHQAHNLESTGGGVQMMDTSEQDQHHHQHDQSQQTYGQSVEEPGDHQFVTEHHHHQTTGDVSIKQEQPDMSPVELLSCDLFTNCSSNFGDERQTRNCTQAGQQQRSSNDILLTDFNLRSSSQDAGSAGHQVMSPLTNPEDMSDLMMGISSGEQHQQDETTHQSASDQLLLGCETSDTLELFDFKQLTSNCEYRHQLDVKSTTSDTDTTNRLSPIIALVPRCNSTDNAVMQGAGSAIQRMDNQYQQHHASSHFLSNTSPTTATAVASPSASTNQAQMRQNFTEYDNHHHELVISGVHRSATTTSSTEPSNSASCSASPSTSSLINTGGTAGTGAGVQSDASGYLNSGPCSGIPSVGYHDSSSSSFIKLPLPQRQNSEQREPSNSVLSSLLPKALSLDGSDLSSTSYRHHNYNHNHHHHHHQSQQSRTSPLIGSYHRGGGGLSASPRQHTGTFGGKGGGGGNALVNQVNNHMLLIPQSNNQQQHSGSLHQGVNCRHYYQRPSAPSLSPSSGNYSLDSSSSCGGGGRVFASGNQYRSGSVVATSASVSQLIGQQQQQHQHLHHLQQGSAAVNFSRLRTPLASHARLLPILDYVPNWSHSSGGTKVLLIGNWTSLLSDLQSSSTPLSTSEDSLSEAHMGPTECTRQTVEGFTILFDDLIVPASLIQDNVLRCHSPQREPGFIALKVVYKNLIVSEQVLFEIRATPQEAAISSSVAGAT